MTHSLPGVIDGSGRVTAPLYLTGHLAPVATEVDGYDLAVTGALPPELNGRYFRNGEDFFALPSWVQVMLGQGIVPQGYHPIVDDMPESRLVEYVEGVRASLADAVATMPTHQEWVDRYWKATTP